VSGGDREPNDRLPRRGASSRSSRIRATVTRWWTKEDRGRSRSTAFPSPRRGNRQGGARHGRSEGKTSLVSSGRTTIEKFSFRARGTTLEMRRRRVRTSGCRRSLRGTLATGAAVARRAAEPDLASERSRMPSSSCRREGGSGVRPPADHPVFADSSRSPTTPPSASARTTIHDDARRSRQGPPAGQQAARRRFRSDPRTLRAIRLGARSLYRLGLLDSRADSPGAALDEAYRELLLLVNIYPDSELVPSASSAPPGPRWRSTATIAPSSRWIGRSSTRRTGRWRRRPCT